MPTGIPNKRRDKGDTLSLEDQQRIAQEKEERKKARELARQQQEEEIRQRVLAEVKANDPKEVAKAYSVQMAPVWDMALDFSVTKQPYTENEKKALDLVGGQTLASVPEKWMKWAPLAIGGAVLFAIYFKRFFPSKEEMARIKAAESHTEQA